MNRFASRRRVIGYLGAAASSPMRLAKSCASLRGQLDIVLE